MTDEHRVKIKNSNILNALIEHAEGTREMSSTQVTAGLGLLKKVMPDLSGVTHSGELEVKRASELSDNELAAIAIRGSERVDQTEIDPSQLN